MKMIISIVNDEDSDLVSHALTNAAFRVTTIASTGGFLRRGLSTLLCAVEDKELQEALTAIRQCFPAVEKDAPKRCKIFVLNVAEYHHY